MFSCLDVEPTIAMEVLPTRVWASFYEPHTVSTGLAQTPDEFGRFRVTVFQRS